MASLENENSSYISLFIACEEGDLRTIEKGLNGLSSKEICLIRDENKGSLVHYGCRYGKMNIVKYLIEVKCIDISELRTEHGATVAHDAAVCDQVEVLKYIFHPNENNICQKLRWTVRDEQGNTPLHLAASYNSLRVLQYLLNEELSDPHNRSYDGFLPIHYGCLHGHCESVEMLLLKSRDTINEQTNELLTPIHLACQSGSFETIHILIHYGANLKLKDQNGFNSLHFACQYSHLKLVEWLIEKQNVNLNENDYENGTALHHAAACGNADIIYYLLEKNAQIQSDNHGNTPLHMAAKQGHQRVCAILIERDSSLLNIRNKQRLTPGDLSDQFGFPSLANELRLRANSLIELEKASIVRLVIKKRNVPRSDASSQVNEQDFIHRIPNIQSTDREDISTSTNNHQQIINGFNIPSTTVAISKYQSNGSPSSYRHSIEHQNNF